jgi:transposase-like protein
MGKQRRKFETGFKQQIVQEVDCGVVSVSSASRKYQISVSVINRWRRQARQGCLDTTPSARERAGEPRAQGKIGRAVPVEVDHLKKLGDWLRRHKNGTTSVITAESFSGNRAETAEIE